MRIVRWTATLTVLALVAWLPSPAAALCLTITNQSSGNVIDTFNFEITGSAGNFFTLALFETTEQHASQGTAYLDGATVWIGVSKPAGLALVGYSCQLALASLTGICQHNRVFPDPANGTSNTLTRNATVTAAACP